MQEETGNSKFVYEIACDQMCGQGHTGMRGEIVVETQEEFDQWMASQKPKYAQMKEDLEGGAAAPAPAAGTTAKDSAKVTIDSTAGKKDSTGK